MGFRFQGCEYSMADRIGPMATRTMAVVAGCLHRVGGKSEDDSMNFCKHDRAGSMAEWHARSFEDGQL